MDNPLPAAQVTAKSYRPGCKVVVQTATLLPAVPICAVPSRPRLLAVKGPPELNAALESSSVMAVEGTFTEKPLLAIGVCVPAPLVGVMRSITFDALPVPMSAVLFQIYV